MAKGYYEYMTAKPAELVAYIQESPIAYVPFGCASQIFSHSTFERVTVGV